MQDRIRRKVIRQGRRSDVITGPPPHTQCGHPETGADADAPNATSTSLIAGRTAPDRHFMTPADTLQTLRLPWTPLVPTDIHPTAICRHPIDTVQTPPDFHRHPTPQTPYGTEGGCTFCSAVRSGVLDLSCEYAFTFSDNCFEAAMHSYRVTLQK